MPRWPLVLVVRLVRGVGAGGGGVLGGAWVPLAVCWWGASSLWGWAWGLCCCGRTGALSGSRPTPVAPPWGCRPLLRWGVVAPRWGVLPPPVLVGVCWVRPFRRDPSFVGGCGGCGGLFVICIVVASIFVVCARPPFLFRLARVRGACGGACGPRARPVAGVWACFLLCVVLWGIRWMPWHQELMKDVAACDMPRGVGERALIRGCPNGGTRPGLCWATII